MGKILNSFRELLTHSLRRSDNLTIKSCLEECKVLERLAERNNTRVVDNQQGFVIRQVYSKIVDLAIASVAVGPDIVRLIHRKSGYRLSSFKKEMKPSFPRLSLNSLSDFFEVLKHIRIPPSIDIRYELQ